MYRKMQQATGGKLTMEWCNALLNVAVGKPCSGCCAEATAVNCKGPAWVAE